MLAAALLGHRASSTRAELGAGVAAMFANAPTHQATDSMAYLLKATQIVGGALPKKPFNILPDSDLWEWFARLVKAKGADAVKLTKVKGHATDEMVNQGKVKADHKEGNDASDEAADIGVEQHGNGLLELSIFFAAKQTSYGGVMLEVAKFVLAIMNEVSALKNQHKPGINHTVYKKICK